MRTKALLVASVLVLATAAPAQQAVPDAPQPQKKQPAKAPDTPPPPPKDDNAFPEDQSKAAADAASQKNQSNDDNAFPEAQSKAAADAAKQEKPADQDTNPFPEEQSKAAAKAAGNDASEKPVVPVHDPARSRKDVEVGRFYLDKGDYQGALLRYQDATATDPSNADAIFGLAQAQHNLKKDTDALKNYELFLRIVPDGPKAKQAIKALKEIEKGK
jgi:tetratricopeptide (TPR) repeat protein